MHPPGLLAGEMHVRARDLLARQHGVVAVWQLRAAGMSEEAVATMVRGWHRPHDGVYIAAFHAPTPQQRWWAATLTAPRTVLSHASAAACHELWRERPGAISVTRAGTTGVRRSGLLVVRHSRTLAGDVTRRHGLLITTVERTIIDCVPGLAPGTRTKLLREAMRRRLVTPASMTDALDRHRGRRGIAGLRADVRRLEALGLSRCASDAEAFALEVLAGARRPLPAVGVRIAGFQTDLSWPQASLIIELDGPQWHRDKAHDGRKTRAWCAAGWVVRRLSTDVLFRDPGALLDLAPR